MILDKKTNHDFFFFSGSERNKTDLKAKQSVMFLMHHGGSSPIVTASP